MWHIPRKLTPCGTSRGSFYRTHVIGSLQLRSNRGTCSRCQRRRHRQHPRSRPSSRAGTSASAPAALYGGLRVAPTRAEVEQWLAQAQQLNLTDATSQRGIRFLEQLLLALTPKETMLLANYPNPFNPETWIPYQLANPADVSVRIYAVDGTLVRTLSLGHKAIGTYQNRSRAAYWDGKNELGESVASGVYFYTLTTGDFTATRKMLIRK